LLSHLRHNKRVNIPYYLLGCLKNMAHYSRKTKDPPQSLTHHCLVQLLINRGFEQQNHPLNNPPINPVPAAEAPEIPEEQQQQNPPVSPEIPHSLLTPPTSPPIIPESSHTAPESSTSILHILRNDSEPDNPSYPIIEERPPRKRKQIAPFPPFLRKKRTRTSMRPPWMNTTLDPPPIQLKPRKPLTSLILGSLPIQTMGAVTREPDLLETVTQSVSHRVAETQELVTHLVAETQEPAMDETQETTTAETQELAADIEMELQELDAHTPFVFNKEAETQSAIHPVAETQEPATDIEVELQELETSDAAAAETQEPATDFEIEEIETQDAVTPPSSSKTAENPGAVTHEPVTNVEIELQESQDATTPPSSSNMAEIPATHSVDETQEPPTDIARPTLVSTFK
jgi:hypothetical protein